MSHISFDPRAMQRKQDLANALRDVERDTRASRIAQRIARVRLACEGVACFVIVFAFVQVF